MDLYIGKKRKTRPSHFETIVNKSKRRKFNKGEERVRSRHPTGKYSRKTIENGMSSPSTKQNISTATAWLDRESYARRKVHSAQFTESTIPGCTSSDGDHIFNIRMGDPLFSFKSSLKSSGNKGANVFAVLNGINHSNFKSSDELDDGMTFIGLANADYNYSISTDKVAITVETSGSGSVSHNGHEQLKEGDLVGYFTGFYQKICRNGKWTGGPDMKWVNINSGSNKTNRVLPRLMKITPLMLTEQHRTIFNILYASVDANSQTMFPTADKFTALTDSYGRHVKKINKLTNYERYSIAKYNDIMGAAMCIIRTLIDFKVLDAYENNERLSNVTGAVQKKKYKALIEQISHLTGFMTTTSTKHVIKGFTDDEKESMERTKKNIIMKCLERYFISFTSTKMKQAEFTHLNQHTVDENLINAFMNSTFNATNEQNLHYLNKATKCIGVVVKGGQPGDHVDIDRKLTFL